MIIPVFDSNIVIDLIEGADQAVTESERYQIRLISIISWIEVMAGLRDLEKQKHGQSFMEEHFTVIGLSNEIAAIAARIRREHRLKLPDAVIWATAMQRETLLVTRNSRDFPKDDPTIRIPYTLHSH